MICFADRIAHFCRRIVLVTYEATKPRIIDIPWFTQREATRVEIIIVTVFTIRVKRIRLIPIKVSLAHLSTCQVEVFGDDCVGFVLHAVWVPSQYVEEKPVVSPLITPRVLNDPRFGPVFQPVANQCDRVIGCSISIHVWLAVLIKRAISAIHNDIIVFQHVDEHGQGQPPGQVWLYRVYSIITELGLQVVCDLDGWDTAHIHSSVHVWKLLKREHPVGSCQLGVHNSTVFPAHLRRRLRVVREVRGRFHGWVLLGKPVPSLLLRPPVTVGIGEIVADKELLRQV